jgi:hypothetical protein
MKVYFTCMACLREDSRPTVIPAFYKEDTRYDVTCRRGHRQVIYLKKERFEILYEIGVNAILDGYFRDAISSFTSSLERFYEFAIRAFSIEFGVETSSIEKAWRSIKTQSERQLGAFVFLYTAALQHPPLLLSNDLTSRRNAVVHKGAIPTQAEAVRYGQGVLDLVRQGVLDLRAAAPGGLEALARGLARIEPEPGDNFSTISGASTITTIDLGSPKVGEASLKEAIIRTELLRRHFEQL